MPAVSQSAYSPSSSDTSESMLANSPQTVLTKSLPPANIMGLPPTQPTTKVHTVQKNRVLIIITSVICVEILGDFFFLSLHIQ